MDIRAISEVVSDLGEGPIWTPETNSVTWTDITQNTFHTANIDTGKTESFGVPSMIGAIAHTKDGHYIAATQKGFARISIDGQYSPLHSFLQDDMRMNDGKVDPAGRFWAGSMALSFEKDRGSLYILETDNSYQKVLDNITLSNGMGWSPDAQYFYYIDSIPGVLKRFEYDLDNGKISNPKNLITFAAASGVPDGMSVSSDGKIVIALWDGGRIEIYEPTGAKVSEIKLGVSRPTCCTFAGPNQDILIISTASQDIDRADEPLAGKILAVTGTGLSGLPTQQYG
ncbi:gluconolactonase [Actinomycetes bacterium]|nr:gluconolactonase [Actinomycetes bacterium]